MGVKPPERVARCTTWRRPESRVLNGGVGLPPAPGWGSLEHAGCASSPGGPPEAERACLLRRHARSGLQACLSGGSSTTHVHPHVGQSLGLGTGELRRGSGTSGMWTFGQPMGSHNGAAGHAGCLGEEGPVGAGVGAVWLLLRGVDMPVEGPDGCGKHPAPMGVCGGQEDVKVGEADWGLLMPTAKWGLAGAWHAAVHAGKGGWGLRGMPRCLGPWQGPRKWETQPPETAGKDWGLPSCSESGCLHAPGGRGKDTPSLGWHRQNGRTPESPPSAPGALCTWVGSCMLDVAPLVLASADMGTFTWLW
ncbi:hypothetical protein K439DRAFT_1613082 [Ramaria rubella]|nr:hypothetical protein K439DRAFT_1613082 [Ramaria rubella]